jgi:hypothetical protein
LYFYFTFPLSPFLIPPSVTDTITFAQIRLVTTPHTPSAETIRLWIERSGKDIPLDIEIYVRVPLASVDSAGNSDLPLTSSVFSLSKKQRKRLRQLAAVNSLPGYGGAPYPPHIGANAAVKNAPRGDLKVLPPSTTPPIVPSNQISDNFLGSGGIYDRYGVQHAFSSAGARGFVTSGPGSSPVMNSLGGDGTSEADRRDHVSHWGHVAIFYLVQEMKRWERFVFRFERSFSSMSALRNINGKVLSRSFVYSVLTRVFLCVSPSGNAPLLKEFEISCSETGFYVDHWPNWLPSLNVSTSPFPTLTSAPSTSPFTINNTFGIPAQTPLTLSPAPHIPKLEALTLQLLPFRWTSPLFHTPTALHTLNLKALPAMHIPLNQILGVISSSKGTLKKLRMWFANVGLGVLPLNAYAPQLQAPTPSSSSSSAASAPTFGSFTVPLSLPKLTELTLGGHGLLQLLIDRILVTPELEELNLDLDSRNDGPWPTHFITQTGGPGSTIQVGGGSHANFPIFNPLNGLGMNGPANGQLTGSIEEGIMALLERSGKGTVTNVGLRHLSVGFGFGWGRGMGSEVRKGWEVFGEALNPSYTSSPSPSSSSTTTTASSSSSSSTPWTTTNPNLLSPSLSSSFAEDFSYQAHSPPSTPLHDLPLLAQISTLESLKLGGVHFDMVVSTLGIPDEDGLTVQVFSGVGGTGGTGSVVGHTAGPATGGAGIGAIPGGGPAIPTGWHFPNLTSLSLKNTHAHPDIMVKFVQLIEARNPGYIPKQVSSSSSSASAYGVQGVSINGVVPKRLRLLELDSSVCVGEDVACWLRGKVEEVLVGVE